MFAPTYGRTESHRAMKDVMTQDPSGRISGRLWLARLDRVPPTPGGAAVPRFRLQDPTRLLLPAHDTMAGAEKNWVPFVHNDTIHFVVHSNPPETYRMPPATEAVKQDVTVEFVSVASERIQWPWQYGKISGGTPAVYDAELGRYVTIFHSKIRHERNGSLSGCTKETTTYYMGCAVFAARPPFAFQHISVTALAGPDTYTTPSQHYKGWKVVFPVGILLHASEIVISYGKNDFGTHVMRLDRATFTETLLPPVPEGWDGQHKC